MLLYLLCRRRFRKWFVASPFMLQIRKSLKLADATVFIGRRWDKTVLEPMVFYRPKRRWFGRKVQSRPIPRDESAFTRAHRLQRQRNREEGQAFMDSRRGQTVHVT